MFSGRKVSRMLTLVFEINDMKKFETDNPNIKKTCLNEDYPSSAYSCADMSGNNEVLRAHLIRQVINLHTSGRYDADATIGVIRSILALKSPNEFEEFESNLDEQPSIEAWIWNGWGEFDE